MQILKKTIGLQTVYRLIDSIGVGDTLGQAVVSETPNGIRLHTIYVRAKHRRKGFGDALMKVILGERKPITLCTGFGNVSFFKRYAFEITKTNESLVFMKCVPTLSA
jgi:GNAT superfamily N-acetyltransferase